MTAPGLFKAHRVSDQFESSRHNTCLSMFAAPGKYHSWDRRSGSCIRKSMIVRTHLRITLGVYCWCRKAATSAKTLIHQVFERPKKGIDS